MKHSLNKILSGFLTFILLLTMFLPASVFAGTGDPEVDKILVEVVDLLLTVAGCVCLGKLIHIGILFLTAGVAEKSNAKMALIPWIIGTIVCFGASWIGSTIIDVIGAGMNGDVLST